MNVVILVFFIIKFLIIVEKQDQQRLSFTPLAIINGFLIKFYRKERPNRYTNNIDMPK